MKIKRIISLALAAIMTLTLAACAGSSASSADLTPYEETDVTATSPELTAYDSEGVTVRVGSLKGPTTMGLVNLMKANEEERTHDKYEFTMATAADEIAAGIVGGTLDIALVPANLASVLYKRTDGGISVIDINTLGVLYCVTGDSSIKSVKDLAGKTVYLTGQGTTPEYALRYLLDQNGVECTLEFKSEATEVAALLKENSSLIAVLPQPFATVAQVQNSELSEAFSLTDEWDALGGTSRLLTGVTIVRNEFFAGNKDAVDRFVLAHAQSVNEAADDYAATAALVAEYGIIEKAAVAEKALPKCGITCIVGSSMKEALSGYLGVLYASDPASVGGQLPDDAFYYVG